MQVTQLSQIHKTFNIQHEDIHGSKYNTIHTRYLSTYPFSTFSVPHLGFLRFTSTSDQTAATKTFCIVEVNSLVATTGAEKEVKRSEVTVLQTEWKLGKRGGGKQVWQETKSRTPDQVPRWNCINTPQEIISNLEVYHVGTTTGNHVTTLYQCLYENQHIT